MSEKNINKSNQERFYDVDKGKEVLVETLPSGVKIQYSKYDSKLFNDGYKDRTKSKAEKKKRIAERKARFFGKNKRIDVSKYKRRCRDDELEFIKFSRKRVKPAEDEDFNEDYIKRLEDYYNIQLDGCLLYLQQHFWDNSWYTPRFLWISDLIILYKCIIKKLRGLLIKLYLCGKLVGVDNWDYNSFSSGNTFYMDFINYFELLKYVDKLKFANNLKEDVDRYKELSSLLLNVEKSLKNNGIVFKKRTILNYKTILSYGR